MRIFKNLSKTKVEIVVLLLVVATAFILRTYSLSRMTFYFDEVVYTMAARDLVEKNVSPWVLAWQPPLFTWINSISVRMFGLNEFSMRIPTAIFGALSVFVIYFLARIWYGKKYALLSAILLAVSPLSIIYSRIAFSDIIQTFFLICSIAAAEYSYKQNSGKKEGYLFLILSGIFFALAFLTKYNSVILGGTYWIFNFGYCLIYDKQSLKKNFFYFIISNLVAVVISIIVILISGGIPALVYVVFSVLFWAEFQHQLVINPFYYYILVLIDSLSPLLFVIFPVAILSILFYKKKNRVDNLVLFLVIVNIALLFLQTRRSARYYLFIIPFFIILISRFLLLSIKKISLRKYKTSALAIVILVILSSAAWSFYEVNKTNDFRVWAQAGKYINNNYPKNVTIHVPYFKNRQLKHYTDYGYKVDTSPMISQLKKGDVVIFTTLSQNSTMIEHAPLEDQTIFYYRFRNESQPEFDNYVLKNGRLVKTFKYRDGNALWIYEIERIMPNNKNLVSESEFRTSLFGLWDLLCSQWQSSLLQRFRTDIFSAEQIKSINKRCNS